MTVVLNGEETSIEHGSNLEQLLHQVEIDPKGVAIALDGEVVPRSRWRTTALGPGARIEIVSAAAGG